MPPGVPDQDGLIAPPSMPLELDFDNLESASNYMHTYALSQGFDIRIQWSANNQTRICWSCYRGGLPETINADGTPNAKRRRMPKSKERRKRGSLKIGCPFRVQCTKNWKTGKMELRIIEGRHKHQMETDRSILPSQVRRLRYECKGSDSSGTPQAGNAAANAVAQAANLTATPTSASVAAGSRSQSGAASARSRASASIAATNGSVVASSSQPSRSKAQAGQSKSTVVNASTGSSAAQQHLGLLGTPTPTPMPRNGPAIIDDVGSDSASASSDSSVVRPSFERQMLNLLNIYDRSEAWSRLIMDQEIGHMLTRAEARLDRCVRRKRKSAIGTTTIVDHPSEELAVLTVPTSTSGGAVMASLAKTAWNARITSTATPTGSPLRTASVAGAPHTPLAQLAGRQQTAPPNSGKGSSKCSNCKEHGHNRRRCPLG